tara:strand:- start:84 stop:557 length:474 start_codon:yes stop_codon:yes gene_type:complete
MRKLLLLLSSAFFVLTMSSCTIVNTSFPTGSPTLSELDISDEFTAKAEVTKILGFDFQRLFGYTNSSIGGPAGSLDGDLSGIMLAQTTGTLPLNSFGINAPGYTYALNVLMSENPGYDVIVNPKFDVKIKGLPGLYVTEEVTVTSRLGKIKSNLLKK